jgi:predicted ATPase
MAELQRRFERARGGERQVVLISGDAGLGKTTLVRAFLAAARRQHEIWIAPGRCLQQQGPSEPFAPMVEALRRLADSPAREALARLLRQHAPTWLSRLPEVAAGDVESAARAASAPAGRMLREMITGVEALARDRPLVIVLEDLNWSDTSTIDLLGAIARRSEPTRLLVLGTYRPIEVVLTDHPLKILRQDLHASRRASRSPSSHSAKPRWQVCSHHLPDRPASPPLVRSLHRHSAGNPLFLEHLASRLAAEGLLAEGSRGDETAADVRRVLREIPTSLRAMIADVFRRLEPGDRGLLEAAAVAGSEFAAAAVAAALEQDPLEEVCARLSRDGRTIAPRNERVARRRRLGTLSLHASFLP